jgi:thiol-disulfide isomerase/thioredoxin
MTFRPIRDPGVSRAAGLSWLLLLAWLVLGGSACFDSPGQDANGPRQRAPEFALTRLDGMPVSLAEHRGKTVILDFWATWCAPCEVQMPVLDALWKARGGDDLMVLGISVDTDPAPTVIAWVEEREFEYPIAIARQDLALDYGVLGFPTLVVIDPDGGVHTRHVGVLSRPELEEILDEIAQEERAQG